MSKYKIPYTYIKKGQIEVEASSQKEAIKRLENYFYGHYEDNNPPFMPTQEELSNNGKWTFDFN